ncbi:MAG: sugar O-acetyltransferase, partial [Mesorhizobium sp.]
MMRSQKEKMLAGEFYNAADPEIQADLLATGAWLKRYNDTLGQTTGHWHELLSERLGEVGRGTVIRPPFFCDYGFNIRIGANAYINFNCVILDVVEVKIGQGTAIGPAVQIYT